MLAKYTFYKHPNSALMKRIQSYIKEINGITSRNAIKKNPKRRLVPNRHENNDSYQFKSQVQKLIDPPATYYPGPGFYYKNFTEKRITKLGKFDKMKKSQKCIHHNNALIFQSEINKKKDNKLKYKTTYNKNITPEPNQCFFFVIISKFI